MQTQHAINRFRRAIKKLLKMDFVPNLFDYGKVSLEMRKRNDPDPNHLLGAFAEWDNTPRHGTNGTIFSGFSLEKFQNQLCSQLQKSYQYNKPYLIIDAWNEWGEGAFLEPDNIYKYGKLEAVWQAKKMVKDIEAKKHEQQENV